MPRVYIGTHEWLVEWSAEWPREWLKPTLRANAFFVEWLAEWLREWLRARGVELRRGPSVHHKVRVGCYATSTLTVTSCTGTS